MNTMWCSNCAQDVPGRPTADKAGYRCPRCRQSLGADLDLVPPGKPLSEQSCSVAGPSFEQRCATAQRLPEPARPSAVPSPKQPRASATPAPASGVSSRQAQAVAPQDTARPVADQSADQARKGPTPSAAPAYDSWELDEQLREVARRYLGPGQPCQQPSGTDDPGTLLRVDRPHAPAQQPHSNSPQPYVASPRRRRPPRRRRRTKSVAGVAWLALSLGTSAFVCGGILLGWSLLANRPELWTVGLPVALCGQVALLVGLILQLDRLWHDHRRAQAKLDNVGEQLHVLRQTTTLLGNSPSSPGTAFYAHLAEGAGPQLLLSDLKSQLDLLAVRISQLE